MRKVIRIFLASSIRELNREREQLENFIRHVSDRLEERYEIKLQPLLCENFDHGYTVERSQERYNREIRGCDLCFFIFCTGLGEYTLEEFRVATEQFAATGKPAIHTFFKEDAQPDERLADFRDRVLSGQYSHFYDTFSHVDTLKLRMLTVLQQQELDFVQLQAEDGYCTLDGQRLLPLENVMEFANNRQLPALKQALRETEEAYWQLKTRHQNGEQVYALYMAAATRRKELREQIEKLQEDIFSISQRMVEDSLHGRITQRQQEAYHLFRQGDYEGCMAILDPKEIDADYTLYLEQNRRQQRQLHRNYIREYVTRIELLQLQNIPDRTAKIDECYQKIVPVALREKLELNAVYEYTKFLIDHKRDAISLLEQLRSACVESEECDEAFLAAVVSTTGIAYDEQGREQEAQEAYEQIIGMYRLLCDEEPEKYLLELALSFSNAGVFYENHGDPVRAMKLYEKALNIQTSAVDPDPLLLAQLANSFENAGILAVHMNDMEMAGTYLHRALDIREQLAQEDPQHYRSDLALSCSNMGNYQKELLQFDEAERYYQRSLQIRLELAESDPEQYLPEVAHVYMNMGVLGLFRRQPEQAIEHFQLALQQWQQLSLGDPRYYRPRLAQCLMDIGLNYMQMGLEAGPYLQQAAKLGRQLVEESPTQYALLFARCQDHLGHWYRANGDCSTALECQQEAIDCMEKALEAGDVTVTLQLARTCINAAISNEEAGFEGEKTDRFYQRAMELLESLSQENTVAVTAVLALAYLNYGVFTKDQQWLSKALNTALQYPDHPDCARIIRMLAGA